MQSNRWDWAWKALCDPEQVWGKWFLSRLLKAECSDIQTAEVVSLETSQQKVQGPNRYMDKLLLVKVDKSAHKVHMEFQSSYEGTMARRMLEYGLRAAGSPARESPDCEFYNMPDSYIIDVHNTKHSEVRLRVLELSINRQLVRIPFPVINACNEIPEIGEMMQAATIKEWAVPFKRLGRLCKGYLRDTPNREVFITACSLLAQTAAFEPEGADEQQVREVVKTMEFEGITFEEAGYRRGVAAAMEGAVKRLQENMRITEQEARRLLGLDEDPGTEKVPSKPISNLNL